MEKSNEEIVHDPVQLIARIMAALPVILIKSGTAWLSFKRQAKKGGNAFQKELLKQGVDRTTAKRFTQQYTDGSNLVKTLFKNSS
jgi:uncharacterized protein YajQ (UPF0234 family)